MIKKLTFSAMILALCGGLMVSAFSQTPPQAEPQAAAQAEPPAEVTCFESRKGASEIVKRDLQPGLPNVKCSSRTGAVLWWSDPFDGTVPMGDMPLLQNIPPGKAVVKPRADKLPLLAMCGTACHNGVGPKFIPPKLPTTRKPVPIPTMEGMLPDAKNMQHGRGRIWCLDCHHTTQRNKLVDNFGDPVSFDQPQLLCGKCHGDKMRDWRDGIHGKRIGEWASTGKKRWFTCTECHNAHNVQDGARNRGFIQIAPEASPQLPRGMIDAKHELRHGVAH
jgi:hypothetical protein